MARPGKAHTSEDIWHLSIDDLLSAPKAHAQLAVPGPFVEADAILSGTLDLNMSAMNGLAGERVVEAAPAAEPAAAARPTERVPASKVAVDRVPASKAPAEKVPPAQKPPEGKRPSPRAAPLAPPVPQKPEEPFHWDVDDLLPDLPVTRSSAPKKKSPAASVARPVNGISAPVATMAPVAAPVATVAAVLPPAPTMAPAPPSVAAVVPVPAPVAAAAPVSAPVAAVGPLPVLAPAATMAPVPASAFAPARTEPAGIEPELVSEPLEITDYDSDAITHEVESLTVVFEAPAAGVRELETSAFDASPPDPEPDEAATLEAQHLDAVPYEVPDPEPESDEAETLEAQHLDAVPFELPDPDPKSGETETLEAQHLAAAPFEIPDPDPESGEAETLEAQHLDALRFEISNPEPESGEAETLEAQHLDAIPFEMLPIEPELDEATLEAHAVETLLTESPPAFEPPADELHAAAAVANIPVLMPVEPPPAPNPVADSGSLEKLVVKISAMVESVGTHAREPVQWPAPDDTIQRRALRPMSAPRARAVEPVAAHVPEIESTQTIRALTPLELADGQSSQWFSIQLALSEESIDPEQVPSLDIFGEYRLYCVTGLDRDRVKHSLRLGFFSSELAADAVAGYLRGFFDSPSIKRVSVAERERFAEKGVTARKDIGETGVHAVIELAGPALRPERRTQVSSVKASVPKPSLWSRLVAPLKR